MLRTDHPAGIAGAIARAAGWAMRTAARGGHRSVPEDAGDPLATAGYGGGSVILTRKHGEDVREPAASQLADALEELFDPDGGDEGKHGAARLQYESDDGPVYEIAFTCRRGARFEAWADRQFRRELAPAREATVRDAAEALRPWKLLASGDVQAVRAWRWCRACS